MLGVDPAVAVNFSSCSASVGLAFNAAQDEYHPTYLYVGALLERDIRVLIYVGKHDWICNWVGNEHWTLALEWDQGDAFRAEALRDWKVGGKVAGSTRSMGGLTFATIDGAGHMVRVAVWVDKYSHSTFCALQVPYDKPKESLELVKRWLAGKEL